MEDRVRKELERKGFQEVRDELMKCKEFKTFQQVTPGLFIGPQLSCMQVDKLR